MQIRDMNSIVYERKLIYEHILPIVKEIRADLARKYNINKDPYKDYQGLCICATNMFIDKMSTVIDSKEFPGEITLKEIHGELAHHPKISSEYWPLQHSMAIVCINNTTIYVDLTCQQFKSIDSDIPGYYISVIEPNWFYPDYKNPALSGITSKINKLIQIPRLIDDQGCHGGKREVHDGIIEFFQYEIWGFISDTIIRTLKGYKKKGA